MTRNPKKEKKNDADFAAEIVAAHLIEGVILKKRSLMELDHLMKGLLPSQKATAMRLAQAVLRHRSNLDKLIDPMLQKRPPPFVRIWLWLMICEMQLFGTPDYAVVDRYVEIAKSPKYFGGRYHRFVNALGRKIAALPAETLTSRKAQKLPKSLRGKFIAAYGQGRVDAMEALFATQPPIDIYFRSPQDFDKFAPKLGGENIAPQHMRLQNAGMITALPGYEEGAWWVQDIAAACPARHFKDLDPLQILDICAAPGGKTMQLSAFGHKVDALDISGARLKILQENFLRTKLPLNAMIEGDILNHPSSALYDAVLIDAPCSATGTIRRHPDLPSAKSNLNLAAIVDLQKKILEAALCHLKPGGTFVFATCSLLPQEGEALADWIAQRYPRAIPDPIVLPEDIAPYVTQRNPNEVRITPDQFAEIGGADGFFYCAFKSDTELALQESGRN